MREQIAPIVCLAGKPPRPGTVVAVLISSLAAHGVPVTLELPKDVESGRVFDWPDQALIVHRGLSHTVLRQLAEIERQSRTFCNRVAATLASQDRTALLLRLAAAGLPVPASAFYAHWSEARNVAAGRDVVVKGADATVGRGSQVIFSNASLLPDDAPFPGPYIVEERIPSDGIDRKLYVAGSACFGLLKPWPRRPDKPATAFDPPAELRELAIATGRATGLEIFGVDVVVGPAGPVIVDVNVFPGFRGVAGGADAVIDHIRRRASGDVGAPI